MIDEVAAALDIASQRTATELRDILRAQGRVSMTTADVLRALVDTPARFHRDNGEPPRWTHAVSEPADPPRLRPPAPPPQAQESLYAWQREALAAWRRQRSRGVVEAVTGTGKTRLGVSAILETLDQGGQAVVLVPTCELLHQWQGVLQTSLGPGPRIGLLGDGRDGSLGRDDVVIAVVNSAREPLTPRRPGSLLVGDECHRYASTYNRLALNKEFPRRLGLTATLERPDGGHIEWLAPYFGRTCFRIGYARAIRDGVVARFTLALIAVRFTPGEREVYEVLTGEIRICRAILLSSGVVRAEPIGAFFEDVSGLARGDGPLAPQARAFLLATQQRQQLLSETGAKSEALLRLEGPLRSAERALCSPRRSAGPSAPQRRFEPSVFVPRRFTRSSRLPLAARSSPASVPARSGSRPRHKSSTRASMYPPPTSPLCWPPVAAVAR